MGDRLGDSVVGSSAALARALKPDARPDRAPYIAGRPLSLLARFRTGSARHALRKVGRSFKVMAPVRPISMPLDVLSLQSFYGSPLGGVARRLIGRVIRERWDSSAGLSIAAVGYGAPYLDRFRDGARRCLALMPANRASRSGRKPDVAPQRSSTRKCCRCLTAPSTGCCSLTRWRRPIGRTRCSKNSWRITAPEGRMIVIVPSRRGVWARTDSTPTDRACPIRNPNFATCFIARISRRSSGARRFMRRRSPGPS